MGDNDFTDSARKLLDEYIHAVIAVCNDDIGWFDRYVPLIEKVHSVIHDIKQLNVTIFRMVVEVGAELNRLQGVITFSGLSWRKFCAEHFPQSESTILRYQTVAKAKVDEDYFQLGWTKIAYIAQGVASANKHLSAEVPLNEVLGSIDFSSIQKNDCNKTARNQVYKLALQGMQEFEELKVDTELVNAAIDVDTSKNGLTPTVLMEELNTVDAEARDSLLNSRIASGCSMSVKRNSKTATCEDSIFVLYGRFCSALDTSEQRLSLHQIEQLQILLSNYLVSNI